MFFGQILYGKIPYQGTPEHAVLAAIEEEGPPYIFSPNDLPLQSRVTSPFQLQPLIERCWHNNPARRPTATLVYHTLTNPSIVLQTTINTLMRRDQVSKLSGRLAHRWLTASPSLSLNRIFREALCTAARDASFSMVSLLLDGCIGVDSLAASQALYCLVAASQPHPELNADRVAILRLLMKVGAGPNVLTIRQKNILDLLLNLPERTSEGALKTTVRPRDLMDMAMYYRNFPLISSLIDLTFIPTST